MNETPKPTQNGQGNWNGWNNNDRKKKQEKQDEEKKLSREKNLTNDGIQLNATPSKKG